MTVAPSTDRLNGSLARLLEVGTRSSCGLIAIGIALPAFGAPLRSPGARLVTAGIVVLIALPALRVAVMGVWFLLRRERDFALIAAAVLAIIVVSTLLGLGAG